MTGERSTDEPLLCPQCGAELQLERPQLFPICSHCGSTLWIDKTRVVFHWVVPSELDEAQARAALERWMAGSEIATGLGRKSVVRSVSFLYFPMWLGRTGGKSEKHIVVAPGAATSVSELKQLRLPPGRMRKYEVELNLPVQVPNVPLENMLRGVSAADPVRNGWQEISLVHVPVYTFKYDFRGRSYTAIVEGSTGSVFANIYPTRRTWALDLVAAITVLTYAGLAAYHAGIQPPESLETVAAQAPLFALATVVLFLWATWVARG